MWKTNFKTENRRKLGIIVQKSPDRPGSKASCNKQNMQHVTQKQLYEKLRLKHMPGTKINRKESLKYRILEPIHS